MTTTPPDRAAIAAKYKIPAELAGRLRGETVDELEADARALAKHFGPPLPPADGGPRGIDETSQLSRAALRDMSPEQIQQALADGRLDRVRGIER